MKGDEETEDIQERVEAAFTQSENHQFDGEKLEPYSMARRCAAQAIGLRFGALDSAHQARFEATQVYPGALRDVAVVLWLCTVRDERELDRAARDPVGAAITAQKWLESKGIIDTRSELFLDAYLLFVEILNEIEVSRSALQKKTTTTEPLLTTPT